MKRWRRANAPQASAWNWPGSHRVTHEDNSHIKEVVTRLALCGLHCNEAPSTGKCRQRECRLPGRGVTGVSSSLGR